MKYIIALIFFCSDVGTIGAQQREDSIRYMFTSPDHLSHQSLVLKKDNTFFYKFSACMSYVCADGRWRYQKDTLLLESGFRADDVPVQVIESEDGPAADSMVLFTKNTDGADEFVMYALNGDTINLTDGSILFDKIPPGGIDSFRVCFAKDIWSRWYRVKNSRCNKIVTTVLCREHAGNYIFFRSRRYLRRNGALISLNEEPDYYIDGDFKKIPVILKREKPQQENGN